MAKNSGLCGIFKVKDLNIKTGSYIIVLGKEDAEKMGLYELDRVNAMRLRTKKEIAAVVDIGVEKSLKPGEIGVFEEVMHALDIKEGMHIKICSTTVPESIVFIRKKLDGNELNQKEYHAIITDIVKNNLSEVEITYFVSACYAKGMSLKESYYLTNAIVKHSRKLGLKSSIVCDKHSIGGIAGNRTTMVVVPIIAAAGYLIPKTSSRSITSAAGTADVIEVLRKESPSTEKIKSIIKKTNGCMIWENALNPSGADAKLIKVRHPLKLDPEGVLLASIMAKKKAVEATHVIIDIPIGKTAKIKTKKEAELLKTKFIELGKMLGMEVRVLITDGSQPIGHGIGPVLEIHDVMNVLQNNGPNDLREKAVLIASTLLEMVGEKDAERKVLEILNSGKAYNKFLDIVREQGGRKNIILPKAKYNFSVLAEKEGIVKEISNTVFAKLAMIAGAPKDKAAGIYLNIHVSDHVKRHDTLFTIYTNGTDKLEFVEGFWKKNKEAIKIIKA